MEQSRSLKSALLQYFKDEPISIFGVQELCAKVQKYYTFTAFQMQKDPKHPQPRYEHEIRSLLNKLKIEQKIRYFGNNQYKLA